MKKLLFDFDGTLVDSMPVFVNGMLSILDRYNINYEKDIIKTITPLGLEGTADYFANVMEVPEPKEKIIDLIGEYAMVEYMYNIPAKENVIETLKVLNEKGFKLSILTASPHITLDPCVKRLGIQDLFENIWSTDDFGLSKDNPDIYKQTAEKMDTDIKNIIFFDDNFEALRTAKDSGMTICGVYDIASEDYEDDIKNITDYYVKDFAEIINIIK